MATKPNVALARFADTGLANVTDPPSGSRDTGFVAGDPADEGVVNALLKQHYLWALYLSDGALSGNHVIDGALEVTGATTLTGGIANTVSLAAGATVAAGPLALQGIVTPPDLSAGNNNNYNPTGLASAVVLRIGASSGAPFLTGISGGSSGRVLTLVNVNTDDIAITHDDASSTAANRFYLANGATIVVRDNGSVTVWYDSTSSRWRVLSTNL